MSYDLERKHVDLKNSCVLVSLFWNGPDQLLYRYEDEIARLRRQIDGLQTDGPRPPPASSLPSGVGISHLSSASTSAIPRPNLPSIGGIPSSSSTRPNSSGVHGATSTTSGAPSVGHGPSNLFGGMMMPSAGERGEYPSYSNGDHPNKRMRTEDEDRFNKGKGKSTRSAQDEC